MSNRDVCSRRVQIQNRVPWLVAVLALGVAGLGACQDERETIDLGSSSATPDRTTGVYANGIDKVRITVTPRYAGGAPAAGATVRFLVTGSGNVVEQPRPLDTNGTTSGTIASTVPEKKTVTIMVGAGGFERGLLQQPVIEFVRPPDRLAFTESPPENVTAGATFTVKVTIQDSIGNRVASATEEVTIALEPHPGGGTLSGTSTVKVNAVGGVATFSNLRIDRAGTGYRLVASAQGLGEARSTYFNVSAALAKKLGFLVHPSNAVAGAPIAPPIQVAIQDEFNNTVSTAADEVTVRVLPHPSGGTLSETSTVKVNAVGGVATFSNLRINKAGIGFELGASVPGLDEVKSNAFNVDPADFAKLGLTGLAATVTAGTASTVEVRALDAFGNTVPSYTGTVAFFSTDPQAELPGQYTFTTGDSGVHTFPDGVKLKTVGVQTLSVRDVARSDISASLTTTVTVGPAAKLAFINWPQNTYAGRVLSPSPEVAVLDAHGNVVTDATTAITLDIGTNPANGVLSGQKTQNAAAGVATFPNLSIDKPGVGYTLRASATLVASPTNPATAESPAFTIIPSTVVALEFSGLPGSLTAGTPSTVVVRALDSFGNPVPTYNGTVTFTSTDPQAELPGQYTFTTGDSGVHTFTNGVVLKTAGSRTVTVTDGTLTASATATVNAAAANRLAFLPPFPSTGTAGKILSPAIRVAVQDPYGNIVPGANNAVTLSIATGPTGAAALQGGDPVSASGGVASFEEALLQTAGDYTLRATANELAPAVSTTLRIDPDEPIALAFRVQPSNTNAGEPITPAPQVAIEDLYGNVVTSATNFIALAIKSGPGGATLTGGEARAAQAGIATFPALTIDKAGQGYTLEATVTGLDLFPLESAAFEIRSGPVARFAVTLNPTSVTAGGSTSVTVTAQDLGGNTVTGYRGTIHFSSPEGNATLPQDYTFVEADNGTKAFEVTLFKAPSQTVVVNEVPTSSVTGSATATVTPDIAARLAFIQQPPASVRSTDSFEVRVALQDQFGNTRTSDNELPIRLDLAPNSYGAELVGGGVRVVESGVATFPDLEVHKVGMGYKLTACYGVPSVEFMSRSMRIPGCMFNVESEPFDVTPGDPFALKFKEPQPQSVTAGEPFTFEVEIQDVYENRVHTAGNSVTLGLHTDPSNGSSNFSGGGTRQAINGIATFSELRIEKAFNGYDLIATAEGLASDISNQFNVTAAGLHHFLLTGPVGDVRAGNAFHLTVAAKDQFDNTVTTYGGTVSIEATGENPIINPPSYQFQPGDNGQKTFEGCVTLKTAGPQTVTVRDRSSSSITGTLPVMVLPGDPAKLAFKVQPSSTLVSTAMVPAVEVSILDAFNNQTAETNSVTLTLVGGTSGATLLNGGPINAVNGVATFPDLRIDRDGIGYQLQATSGTLTSATSNSFAIFALPGAGDLIITEIMACPSGGSSDCSNPPLAKQWFEVRNVSGKVLTLGGLLIVDAGAAGGLDGSLQDAGAQDFPGFIVAASPVLANGAYFVFAASPTESGGPPNVGYSWAGTSFRLRYPGEIAILSGATVVADLAYATTFPHPLGKAATLSSVVAAGNAYLYPWYWCAAPVSAQYETDLYGSPGTANDTCDVPSYTTEPVNPCYIQWPDSFPQDGVAPLVAGLSHPVYGRFYKAGVTDWRRTRTDLIDGNDRHPYVVAQLGWGTTNNPLDSQSPWTWVAAPLSPDSEYYPGSPGWDNDSAWRDEVKGILSIPTPGNYYYGFRIGLINPADGSITYRYCDKDNFVNADPPVSTNYGTAQVISTSDQIQAVRDSGSGPIQGAYITYLKPTMGSEGAGFTVQAAQAGPALFVAVDPGTLVPSPALGDRVSFNVTSVETVNEMKRATAIEGYTRLSLGNSILGLIQNVSAVSDLVSAVGNYESELITITGTLSGPFTADPAGSGFVIAPIDTAGINTGTRVQIRMQESLKNALGLFQGCNVTVTGTPLWRYQTWAQASVWLPSELSATCPPRVSSAASTSPTSVVITFDQDIDGNTVNTSPATQYTFTGGTLTASAATLSSSRQVTVSTSTQTQGTIYQVTVTGVRGIFGHLVEPPNNTATFTGKGVCEPKVVISQVYGGGGNSGAYYKNDFIELHNRSALPVSIGGWSVQYASATGNTWQVTSIPSGTQLAPGAYYLIQQAAGTGNAESLPTPSLVADPPISMGALAGKVALVKDQTSQLTGECPASTNIVDFVAYGSTASNCYQTGSALNAGNNASVVRITNSTGGRCVDTDNNQTDFSFASPPVPLNSDPVNSVVCGCDEATP
jgi:hypothetical protein